MTITPDHSINLMGVRCPDFIEAVRGFVRNNCVSGEVLYVVSDEPSSARDVQRYCEFLDHDLLLNEKRNEDTHHFVIRKG